MKQRLDINGIITVLNTPFTERNQVDIPSLQKNVQRAINAGVKGFLVPAMASEVGKLSMDERLQMVQCVLDESGDLVKVIGGTAAETVEESCHIAKKFIDLGCHGVLVNFPFQNEIQYRSNIEKILNLNPEFLMIQDWDFTGYGLPVALIQKMFEVYDAFRALKIEVVPAGVKYSEILQATEGKLHVSGGWAVTQMIEGLKRGVHAFLPTGMHYIYTKIYELFHAGKVEKSKLLFEQIVPILAFSNQHLDISVHFFKQLLHQQGIYATPKVRSPILPFDRIHHELAHEHIQRVIILTGEVQSGKWN